MHNLMLVEIKRVRMFTDKRVLNVLLNGFGVMMVYAGMLGGAMVMVRTKFNLDFCNVLISNQYHVHQIIWSNYIKIVIL